MKRKALVGTMVLAMGLWFVALSAIADEEKVKAGGKSEFFSKAAASGMAELNMSELAVRFARAPAVKQFAQKVIADHTRANRELTELANRRSIALPKGMDEEHQKKYDKLKTLSGAEFDRTYMECMVKDHEKAVELFEKESKDGKDDATKRWAGQLTPVLKRHLEHAREVCDQLKDEKKKD